MALTRRGRLVVSVVGALALVAVGGIALALTGHAPAVIQEAVDNVTGQSHAPEPPPTCPLTGTPAPHGEVPHRPVLAVKVENTPDAYPLAGLQSADVVYEELVEGGITRFMALYQCKDAKQVGPVRSARTTDPKVLIQYDPHSVIAYSGGQLAVVNAVERSGLVSFDEDSGGDAFWRDDARYEPHNLFVNTAKLRAKSAKATAGEGPPRRLFPFDDDGADRGQARVAGVGGVLVLRGRPRGSGTRAPAAWQRMLDGAPMTLDTGTPITAANVIIQQVVVTEGDLVDVLGIPLARGHGDRHRQGVDPAGRRDDRGHLEPAGDGRGDQVRDQDRRGHPARARQHVGRDGGQGNAPDRHEVAARAVHLRRNPGAEPGGTLVLMTGTQEGSSVERETGTFRVKAGLAEMLKGGVIMDVTTADQAKIAEDAGACAVMALERVPSDIRRDGGVARMADATKIEEIQQAVTIPVMAKARIGHFVEAQILQSLGRRLHRRVRGAHARRRGAPHRQVGVHRAVRVRGAEPGRGAPSDRRGRGHDPHEG